MPSFRLFWQKEKRNFPQPFPLIIAAMALEYGAWGLCDHFFSPLAATLFHDVFLVGLLVGLAHLSNIISLFVISELLEIVSPIRVAIAGKFISFVVLLGSFCALFFHIPTLLIIAVIGNGIGSACRDTASQEILLEKCTSRNASTILGCNAAFRDGSWAGMMILSGIGAAFVAQMLHLPIEKVLPGVFLAAIPLVLAGMFLLFRAQKKSPIPPREIHPHRLSLRHSADFLRTFCRMTTPTKFAILVLFFLQIIRATILLILPLLALSLNLSFDKIGILMGSVFFPLVFSSLFSVFEDRGDRMLFIITGLCFSAIPLFLLTQTKAPLMIGIFSVLVSFSMSIIRPASLGLIASEVDHCDAPAIASLQVFFSRMGSVVGAFGVGFVARNFGMQNAFFLIGTLSILFALVALFLRFHFLPKIKTSRFFPIHIFSSRWIPPHL